MNTKNILLYSCVVLKKQSHVSSLYTIALLYFSLMLCNWVQFKGPPSFTRFLKEKNRSQLPCSSIPLTQRNHFEPFAWYLPLSTLMANKYCHLLIYLVWALYIEFPMEDECLALYSPHPYYVQSVPILTIYLNLSFD